MVLEGTCIGIAVSELRYSTTTAKTNVVCFLLIAEGFQQIVISCNFT